VAGAAVRLNLGGTENFSGAAEFLVSGNFAAPIFFRDSIFRGLIRFAWEAEPPGIGAIWLLGGYSSRLIPPVNQTESWQCTFRYRRFTAAINHQPVQLRLAGPMGN
jgi:hypothetical protein